jgi:hypothetical protein
MDGKGCEKFQGERVRKWMEKGAKKIKVNKSENGWKRVRKK